MNVEQSLDSGRGVTEAQHAVLDLLDERRGKWAVLTAVDQRIIAFARLNHGLITEAAARLLDALEKMGRVG